MDFDLDAAAPIEYKRESTSPKDYTKTARLLEELREELQNCESTAVYASALHALDRLSSTHSKLQAHSWEGWQAQAAVAAFNTFNPSGSSSSSLLVNMGEILASLPCSSRGSATGGVLNRVCYMFEPKFGELGIKDLSRVSLDKIRAVDKGNGITIALPDGRECLMEGGIVDSGANTLLITDTYLVRSWDCTSTGT